MTDDRRFGIRLEAADYPRFARLQFLLGQDWLGDFEPAIVWADLTSMVCLPDFREPELDPRERSTRQILEALDSDEEVHDSSLLGVGEGFDQWLIRAYVFADQAVFVWRKVDQSATRDPSMLTVPRAEQLAAAEAAFLYYETIASPRRQGSRPSGNRIGRTAHGDEETPFEGPGT
jgi:hypothetical protein